METILIENFKAIRNTAKREIQVANLTILMGEQATGKSTVAKLIYFFKNIPEQILDELLENPQLDSENFSDKITTRLRAFFRHILGISGRMGSFEVAYTYENGFQLKVKNIKGETNLSLIWSGDSFKNLEAIAFPVYRELALLQNRYDEYSRRERERLSNRLSEKVESIFRHGQHSLYVPASRNTVVSLEPYLLEIFSKLDRKSSSEHILYRSENEYIILNFINYLRIIKNRFKGSNFAKLLKAS